MIYDPLAVAAVAVLLAILGLLLARTVSARLGMVAAGPIVLIALTPLVPPLRITLPTGISLDDTLPVVGLTLLALTPAVRRGIGSAIQANRRGLIVAGLGVGLVAAAGVASSVVNGNGLADLLLMTLKSAGRFIYLAALVALIAAAVARAEVTQRVVAVAVATAGAIAAAYGLAAYFSPIAAGVRAGRTGAFIGSDIVGRLAGTTGVPNFTSAILMMSTIVTAGLALSATGRARVVLWLAVLVQAIALTLTFSRVSLGLTILALIVLVLLANRPILLVPLAVVGAVLAAVTPLVSRFVEDSTDRLSLWTAALLLMFDNPVFGVGAGRMLEVVRELPERYQQTAFGPVTSSAHNTILLAGAETGLLGAVGVLLIYAGVGGICLWLLRRSALSARPWVTVAGVLAVLAFLAQGLSNNLFTVGVTGVFGALILGGIVLAPAHLLRPRSTSRT